MITVYNMETGQAETIHAVDAKERIARGGWSYDPVEVMPTEGTPIPEHLIALKVEDLRAYAKEHSITLGAAATTKDAILAVIQAAEAEPKA